MQRKARLVFKASDTFVFTSQNNTYQCGYVQGRGVRHYSIPAIMERGIPKKGWRYWPAEEAEEFQASDNRIFRMENNLWVELLRVEPKT